jgi:hypothetical protein
MELKIQPSLQGFTVPFTEFILIDMKYLIIVLVLVSYARAQFPESSIHASRCNPVWNLCNVDRETDTSDSHSTLHEMHRIVYEFQEIIS